MDSTDCRVMLQDSAIDSKTILDAMEFVRIPECGAVNSFLGCTRSYESNDPAKRKVVSLKYEASEEMALEMMQKAVDNAVSKYPDVRHRIYVSHRLGQVDLGEISLLITIGSPRRETGHTLTMFILNQIKRTVPIFKKILFDNNESQWSTNSEAFWLESEPCKH